MRTRGRKLIKPAKYLDNDPAMNPISNIWISVDRAVAKKSPILVRSVKAN